MVLASMTIFAAPMVLLYLVSIVIAYVVAPRHAPAEVEAHVRNLKLVFAATVLEQASRQRRVTPRADDQLAWWSR